MISDGRPSRNSTEVSRRCNSSSVPASLKIGTTIDNTGARGELRDMTESPSDDMSEVVPDQINALVHQKRPGLRAAQQLDLLFTRLSQPRGGLQQRIVHVPRVHGQFYVGGGGRAQRVPERLPTQHACVNPAGERRRAQTQTRRRAIVALRPWPHRGIQQSLTLGRPTLTAVANGR